MLKEAVVSVTTLGAAFGAFSGGFFSDYYGRCARAPPPLLLSRMHAAARALPRCLRAHRPRNAHAVLTRAPRGITRRRSAIILSDLIFALGALKMGVAMTPRQLIEGRCVMGVAIGLASIVGPVYIAESAPNSMRAMMVVMYAIEIGVGTVRRERSPGCPPRSAAVASNAPVYVCCAAR